MSQRKTAPKAKARSAPKAPVAADTEARILAAARTGIAYLHLPQLKSVVIN